MGGEPVFEPPEQVRDDVVARVIQNGGRAF